MQPGTPPGIACRISGAPPMSLRKVTSTMITFEKGHEWIASLYFRCFAACSASPLRSVGPCSTFASRTVPDLRSTKFSRTVRSCSPPCALTAWTEPELRAAPELRTSTAALRHCPNVLAVKKPQQRSRTSRRGFSALHSEIYAQKLETERTKRIRSNGDQSHAKN